MTKRFGRGRHVPPSDMLRRLLLPILCLLIAALSVAGCRERPEAALPTATPASTAAVPRATLPPPMIAATTGEPSAEADEGEGAAEHLARVYSPVVMRRYADIGCDEAVEGGATITGDLVAWHPLTLAVSGPAADEADDSPNPFLDYRLQLTFLGPSGQTYDVPGYFAGDGRGHGTGDVWQARFAPDEAGMWRYCVSFRTGAEVAVSLDATAGEPLPPDGAAGEFVVAARNPEAPGFLKWGRLEYAGGHYLRFRDGPYWIKGGTNSPENFLGYAGFDNTFDQGGLITDFLHAYAPHTADWREGDPLFAGSDREVDSRGIIGALNYLSDLQVNSIYFLPMNLGGDGQDTYPFLSPDGTPQANTHYDISKLAQWSAVLDHAQRVGIAAHVVLNEAEEANRRWLDDGTLGVERKLFYREMVARFSYLLALKWNLSEEIVFEPEWVTAFADYLRAVDWAGHPIAIHNPHNWFRQYELLLGDDALPVMAIQYDGEQAGALVEQWRRYSADTDHPWVIDMDENGPAGVGLGPDNAGQLRKMILYDVYFSGGNIEWYAGYYDLPVGGDVSLEDFRTREEMWRYTWYARRFMEEHLPFWAMEPADDRLSGEAEAFGGGEVFAYGDEILAVYLPVAEPTGVLSVAEGSNYQLRWYDPRTGEFAGEAAGVVASAEGLPLGSPPTNPSGDWVVLVTKVGETGPVERPEPYP